MYLDCDTSLVIHQALTFEVFKEVTTCKLAHETWTKLEDIYGGSNLDEDNILFGELMEEFSTFLNHEELYIASTSNYLDTSISFTSPTCGVPQGNDMVSEEISCDDGVKLICDDMLDLPCCHDRNDLVSSSCSMTNHVEEIKKDEACLIDEEPSSPKESSSPPFVHMCLMARGNDEVSSSLSDNDDSCNEDEDDDLTQNLYEIGKTLHRAKNNTYKRFQDVLVCFKNVMIYFSMSKLKVNSLNMNLLRLMKRLVT